MSARLRLLLDGLPKARADGSQLCVRSSGLKTLHRCAEAPSSPVQGTMIPGVGMRFILRSIGMILLLVLRFLLRLVHGKSRRPLPLRAGKRLAVALAQRRG